MSHRSSDQVSETARPRIKQVKTGSGRLFGHTDRSVNTYACTVECLRIVADDCGLPLTLVTRSNDFTPRTTA